MPDDSLFFAAAMRAAARATADAAVATDADAAGAVESYSVEHRARSVSPPQPQVVQAMWLRHGLREIEDAESNGPTSSRVDVGVGWGSGWGYDVAGDVSDTSMRVDVFVASWEKRAERKEQESYKRGEGWFDPIDEGGDWRCQLGDTLYAFLIPPKGKNGCRDWSSWSQKFWVKTVLVVNSIQLFLTWLLFLASISHFRLQRMKSTTCATVVTDELSGESSIATTCEGAVLVNESVIELKDPLYEAALNYTDLVESGAVDDNSQWNSMSDYMMLAQIIVLEMFLIVFLMQKIVTSIKLVRDSSNIMSMDPSQRHWDLVYCGALLMLFCWSQIIANVYISLLAAASGDSLFTTIFGTFTLLLVADLDDKLLAGVMPPKRTSEAKSRVQEWCMLRSKKATRKELDSAFEEAELRLANKFPARKALKDDIDGLKKRRLKIIFVTGSIFALLFMAFTYACLELAATILLAVNGLRISYYTTGAVTSGTDYSKLTGHL